MREAPVTTTTTTVRRRLPATLSSLYHPRYKCLPRDQLLSECKKVFETELTINDDEAQYLAQSTRLQSESMLWFEHRKGRVTASRFGSVYHTHVDAPSKSLVKSITQQKPTPKVAAMEWGIRNEARARQEYIDTVQASHTAFKVETTGLHVNPEFPHLGASPDGLVSCSCCGDGLLEIKCPYSKRHTSPIDVHESDFYLKPTEEGLKLTHTHNYYHQVQGQMAVCRHSYSDFVCWTPYGLHVERIYWDPSHWDQLKSKLDQFFMYAILPEILCGGSEDKENTRPTQQKEDKPVYCYCRKGEQGQMVACDNSSCTIEWFHFDCVNLTSAPEGEWFCPDCKQ